MTRPDGDGFNLVEDPWIPIGDSEVSIREALVGAHELPGWPGGDYGLAETLLRLLVPIAYRLTGLDNQALSDNEFADLQADLIAAPRFAEGTVSAYLNPLVNRFWLYGGPDSAHPFAQDPTLHPVDPKEPAKAIVQWSSGNNPVLGPHADTNSIPLALATQRLLVLHGYSSGGLHTKHPAHTGRGQFKGGPLRGTMSVHPVGPTLAHTLIAHLVPLPGGDTKFGLPFWEQPPRANPTAAYTDRAGLIEQIAGRHDKTMLCYIGPFGKVNGFTLAEGPGPALPLSCTDPYILYDGEQKPQKPKASKAFWRESEALLPDADGTKRMTAAIINWAVGEYSSIYVSDTFAWAIVAHRGDKSKELDWDCHTAPHLLRLFIEPNAALRARNYLLIANEAEAIMCKQVGRLWNQTDLMPDKPELKKAVYAPARSEFWKLAESGFWEAALSGIPADDEIVDLLRDHALAGFDHASARLTRNSRTLKEVVASRKWIELWKRQQATDGPETGDSKESA